MQKTISNYQERFLLTWLYRKANGEDKVQIKGEHGLRALRSSSRPKDEDDDPEL